MLKNTEAVRASEHTTLTVPAGRVDPERTGDLGTVVLDRYRLLHRLGGGGFGVVWAAHDLKLDRPVAVKRIPCGDPDIARRADRESVAAARLQHPAIVALYETVADDEAVYLVSELVEGATLAELLAEGALSDRDVVEIGLALCDALAHAHRRGVVHRDVKPQNILIALRDDGGPAAKLTDFGVARIVGDDGLTATGDVVGTLAYMAPEQAEGREAGPPADLYALGLCLYEGLAGVNPVRARGAGATARRVGMRLPPLGRLRRDLPLDLCAAIDQAVRPDPQQRGTIADLRAALAAALQDVDDEPGTIEGGKLEALTVVAPPVRTTMPGRLVAAALAAPLAAAAPVLLGDAAGVAPLPAASGAAVAVLLLPRLGWVAAAVVLLAALAAVRPGTALLLAAVVAPVPLLLRRAEPWTWSLPALAPLLGLAGIAPAFAAVAGRAGRPLHRAALGALGGWWLVVVEVASGRTLLAGPPPDAAGPLVTRADSGEALAALATLAEPVTLALIGTLAGGALLAPWLVAGRRAAVDMAGAIMWAAALVGALHAGTGLDPGPLAVVAAAAGAFAFALATPARRASAGLDRP